MGAARVGLLGSSAGGGHPLLGRGRGLVAVGGARTLAVRVSTSHRPGGLALSSVATGVATVVWG